MSKRSHGRQVERARAKRRAAALDRRQARNRIVILVMALLLVLSLVAGGIAALLGDRPGDAPEAADPAADDVTAAVAEPCPPPDGAPEVDSAIYDEPPSADLDEGGDHLVTVDTTCGAFVIELDTAGAPVGTANLVGLAEDGYYDGVAFHRVVDQFVIQAGDPAGTGCGQADCAAFDPDAPTYPGYTFADELATAEVLYDEVRQDLVEEFGDPEAEDFDPELVPGGYPRGTVAMANAGPDTNGSQFFVAQGDPTMLPAGPLYTVLGQVVEGMDVVDRIAGQATDGDSRPTTEIRIVGMTVERRP